ncbi:MAG: 5'-nucleotidase C-terminal domain-containing protein [Nocardioides sp.]
MTLSRHSATRRTVLTGATALSAVGFADTALARSRKPSARLTVLGTSDLHCNVLNWDYFNDRTFGNRSGDHIGIAKASTLIQAVRERRAGGQEAVLTLDAGDTIQGTPLSYYYARIEPIADDGPVHPMASAMNLVGYDAVALGNHEFNYGIPLLRTWERQLDFPLLGANAVDTQTGMPAFRPYLIKGYQLKNGPVLRVGVLGLTNPGTAIWDKAHVEGRLEFPDLVETARKWVPEMRAKGCDLVVVSAHSGADTSSSYGDALPIENASTLVAQQVPGIDAILVGHAHREITQRYVTNHRTGQQVLLCEPLYWGMRVSVLDLQVELRRGRWRLASATSQTLNSNTVDADPRIVAAVQEQHDTVVDYVNSVIGTSAVAMSAARAPVEDVPIIDLVNHVQADAVQQQLTGADATLPVLSIAAPFNRSASFPAGEVTVRDAASLYIYDNTLLAVRVTGAQVKDYLEFSARYFKQVNRAGPFQMSEVTNAITSTAPNGTPDYNFDTVAGLDAPLTYDIDIARPVGDRIANLAYGGTPLTGAEEFVLAVNNYRQSGGGGFPHVAEAPVIYNRQVEIRQLLIDWVTAQGEIDPATFASVDWRLTSGGQPITVS